VKNEEKLKDLADMKNRVFFIVVAAAFGLCRCAAPEEWADLLDNVPPGPVTNVKVENTNGGALITYKLPNDKDIRGAKAVYQLTADGEQLERYATTETISLEGYGDTKEYPVTMYAVDKSGNVSTGASVKIQPMTPPIELIRKSLIVAPTFAGISASWNNPWEKDVAVSLYKAASTGEMILYDTYFSNAENGKTIFRGLDPEETKFRIEMHDRWNNYAQVKDTVVTPLVEMLLPGQEDGIPIWSQYGVDDGTYRDRGDVTFSNSFSILSNGIHVSAGGRNYCTYTSTGILPEYPEYNPYPAYLTLDMGRKAVYSRLNYVPRLRTPNYSATLPIDFEIWGSNDPKPVIPGDRLANMQYWTEYPEVNGTDAWKNDWTKIATCKLVLSSGASKYVAGMELSADDINRYTNIGFDYDVNENTVDPFRYLRIVVYETNTDGGDITCDELTFWGQYKD
jgi:hypothetical protein